MRRIKDIATGLWALVLIIWYWRDIRDEDEQHEREWM